MIPLADIRILKNGTLKVVFSIPAIYQLLREKLGFRFARINNQGYYLQYSKEIYMVTGFYELRDRFLDLVRLNFNKLGFSIPIAYGEFLEAYYKQMPIKNGNHLKHYLSMEFQLTREDKHNILLTIDPDYSDDHSRSEMIKFLGKTRLYRIKGYVRKFS
jgi:hypothetical protein